MKIILLKDIPHIGKKYEVKDIADGHALNYLIPRKLAEAATPARLKSVETLQKRTTLERAENEKALLAQLASLEEMAVEVEAKANEQGHLFKGLRAADISEVLRKRGVALEPEHIELESAIKEVGSHAVPVRVQGREAQFTLVVKAG